MGPEWFIQTTVTAVHPAFDFLDITTYHL